MTAEAQPGTKSPLRLIQTSDILPTLAQGNSDYYQNRRDRKVRPLPHRPADPRRPRGNWLNLLLSTAAASFRGTAGGPHLRAVRGAGYLEEQAHPVFKAMNRPGLTARSSHLEQPRGSTRPGLPRQGAGGADFPYVNASVFRGGGLQARCQGTDWLERQPVHPYLLLGAG